MLAATVSLVHSRVTIYCTCRSISLQPLLVWEGEKVERLAGRAGFTCALPLNYTLYTHKQPAAFGVGG